MDSAILHGGVFNIELKRLELEQNNLSRKEIKDLLEKSYRALSKKHSFTCLCCNKAVNMNLTNEEGRHFYFKHFDGRECEYSLNSKTYEKQISKFENKRKKDSGLTIFKEILEGQLKPLGVKIERGYLYKKKLSFIPDFIIKFPYSDQIWVIDYFTSIAQGVTSGSYAHYLNRRIKTYREEGFKSICFVDDSWEAIDNETDKGTLLFAEKHVTRKDIEDFRWDEFLNQEINLGVQNYLRKEVGNATLTFDTRSILYVNIDNRICKIIRMLESNQYEKNISFYKLSEPTIPLERALSLNSKQVSFLIYRENEEQLRQDFKNSLIKRWEQAELERKEKEAETQYQFENNTSWSKFKSKITEEQIRQKRDISLFHSRQGIDDDEFERERNRIAEEAAKRPVDMSPEQWEWYKKTGRSYQKQNSDYMPKNKVTGHQNFETKVSNEKRENFLEKILSFPISGENYINTEPKYWRLFILKWIKNEQKEDELSISLRKVLEEMKTAGITFNQKDEIAQYPIKNFFEFYQKEIKRDLKIKLQVKYINQ